MDLRTQVNIQPSGYKIHHSARVAFIGSCFAAEIASKMAEGKMMTDVNPFGTVYNPVSIFETLSSVIRNRVFTQEDLYIYKNRYLSLNHYSSFSSDQPGPLLERINLTTKDSHDFLAKAGFLFITFGTAKIYRLAESGAVVSNCHKLPAEKFSEELLDVDYILEKWSSMLDELYLFNKEIKVIFTVSPVRYLKEGAHGNQVSKSILFLAIEKLMAHKTAPGYFPAYEIIMDDLRDYRYYAEDMLHPSKTAVDYIWRSFSECYLSSEAITVWKEARKITKALDHRFLTDSTTLKIEFASEMLNRITLIQTKAPWINFTTEQAYFEQLIKTN